MSALSQHTWIIINMNTSFPSIQSFYAREVSSSSRDTDPEPPELDVPGDGFTSSEVEAVTNPLLRPWRPSRNYEICPISLLQSGLSNYQISGRLVNFTSNPDEKGHHLLIVADGSGAIAVRLCFLKASDYQLLLGQRVTVWATFISGPTRAVSGNIPFCVSSTTIYPGRDGATHIIFHDDVPGSEGDQIMRCPLECDLREYNYLPALMTLKAFLSTGYDMGEGKILVCVRSVGPRRTVYSKKRQCNFDMVDVGIFDDTATCVLKLWADKVPSAKSWVPNETILLISRPTCREGGSPSEIGIGYSSVVDVDPKFPDADWLRNKAKNMSKKQSVCIPFPSDNWDIERAIRGPGRTLFTIADVEDQVRHPEDAVDFTGKLNVILFEMKLMEHWRKGTTCCVECCGVPVYANKPTAVCKNCESRRDLTLNPRIIGSMIDESGMIVASKLVWYEDAWSQLFFGKTANEARADNDSEADLVEQSWEDLTVLGTPALRDIEELLLYARVTLTFGWSSKLERLCILGAEW